MSIDYISRDRCSEAQALEDGLGLARIAGNFGTPEIEEFHLSSSHVVSFNSMLHVPRARIQTIRHLRTSWTARPLHVVDIAPDRLIPQPFHGNGLKGAASNLPATIAETGQSRSYATRRETVRKREGRQESVSASSGLRDGALTDCSQSECLSTLTSSCVYGMP